VDLAKGQADIAIRASEPEDEALVGRKIAEGRWALYASRSYVERHGRPERQEDVNRHFVIEGRGPLANYPAVLWLRSIAPHAMVGATCDYWTSYVLALKSGSGVAPLIISGTMPVAARPFMRPAVWSGVSATYTRARSMSPCLEGDTRPAGAFSWALIPVRHPFKARHAGQWNPPRVSLRCVSQVLAQTDRCRGDRVRNLGVPDVPRRASGYAWAAESDPLRT
jgi:hypothetical protein